MISCGLMRWVDFDKRPSIQRTGSFPSGRPTEVTQNLESLLLPCRSLSRELGYSGWHTQPSPSVARNRNIDKLEWRTHFTSGEDFVSKSA